VDVNLYVSLLSIAPYSHGSLVEASCYSRYALSAPLGIYSSSSSYSPCFQVCLDFNQFTLLYVCGGTTQQMTRPYGRVWFSQVTIGRSQFVVRIRKCDYYTEVMLLYYVVVSCVVFGSLDVVVSGAHYRRGRR
jgi:hypothetical protein